jgi:hypothetical protein
MHADEVLRVKLEMLRREHRDLDEAIRALEEKGTVDALMVRRLKKQKLGLKDRISALEDQLTPDIIA